MKAKTPLVLPYRGGMKRKLVKRYTQKLNAELG